MKFPTLSKFLFLALALSFFACEEIPPTVTGSMGNMGGGPNSDDLKDQQRQVLIEEFTGVRCVQCPAGSALIEDLLAANGVQLVAVSIHSGIFSPPYNESLYDFRTEAGDELLNFLGEPLGYPSAVVNRQQFDGELALQLGDSQWAGYINEEKLTPPKVKIGVTTDYDDATRNLKMEVLVLVEETITEEARLHLMFTESGIVDVQKIPGQSDPDPDYVHKHVLRGMATNFTGDIIQENMTAGAEIEREYNFKLPDDWVAEKCHVIAFVSLGGDSKEVLQAVEATVAE